MSCGKIKDSLLGGITIMYNVIVTEPSANIRLLARQALARNWKVAIIAVLIYEICITLPALILDQLFGKTMVELMNDLYLSSGNYGAFADLTYNMSSMAAATAGKFSTMSSLYIFLVTGAFTLGLTVFFLNLSRRRPAEPDQVFSGFEQFFKALGLTFVMGIFVFLWSLLFVIPGIIAMLRYSQAFYILADDPSKPIMQCIRESKLMMMGNKGKLFCLMLSFIGWSLLTVFAIGFISNIIGRIIGWGIVYTGLSWILDLGICWVTAYLFTAKTVFYEILKGNLRAQTYTPGQY